MHLIARLFFRGIYYPQMGVWAWMKVVSQNRQTISKLVVEALGKWRQARKKRAGTYLPALSWLMTITSLTSTGAYQAVLWVT